MPPPHPSLWTEVIATGRPQKISLDWFPLDCNALSDPKLRRARQEFGYLAIVVYLELLCILYRDKGYYIEYNEETRDDVIWTIINDVLTGEYEPKPNTIRRLIDCLVACRLFSHDLYRMGYITSHRAQEQYYRMTSKRAYARVNYDIWLLDADEMKEISPSNPIYLNFISASETGVSPAETPFSASESTQKKEEEKTAEKIKKDQNIINDTIPEDTALPVVLERFENLFEIRPNAGFVSAVRELLAAGKDVDTLLRAVDEAAERHRRQPKRDVTAYVIGTMRRYEPPAAMAPPPSGSEPMKDWEREWMEDIRSKVGMGMEEIQK